jgi:SAM-dependent methyltransferase
VDACFNAWLLDDLSEPAEYFKEVARILKDDGIAIMLENTSFPEHDAPHDFFRFTRYGLQHLAQKHALSLAEMRALGGFWAQIGTWFLSFFLKGASGHLGGWVRILNPPLNSLFYLLDRVNSIPRGTSGHVAIFRKVASATSQPDAAQGEASRT